VAQRWGRERVAALAPDAASQRAAQRLAVPSTWPRTGWATAAAVEPGPEGALWGECRGSAASPYRTVVDLAGPAYRCTCPSRKFPCKHALGLLLLWSEGAVSAGPDLPGWAAEWLAARGERATRRDTTEDPEDEPAGARSGPADPAAARRRAQQREARVAAGMTELDRWLCDQVWQGLAEAQRAGYRHWDTMAARLVDAQAPAAASLVRELASVSRSGADWAGRLLEEYALLRLLTTAFRGQHELPAPLRETVRSRIGFTLRQADVPTAQGAEQVRDRWDVLALRDLERDNLRTRRVWLRGRRGGRFALVLSFSAVAGQALDGSLVVGTTVEAGLAFYPAAAPLRAVVLDKQPAIPPAGPPQGATPAALLASWAEALARDPWLDAWPAVLADVVPARASGRDSARGPARGPAWSLADACGDALPLHPGAQDCWPLVALSGGHPVTVAGEWSPGGFWPLTGWDRHGRAVVL
jgi:SWIM zinc finger